MCRHQLLAVDQMGAHTLHGSAPARSSLLMNARRGTLYLRICLSTVML